MTHEELLELLSMHGSALQHSGNAVDEVMATMLSSAVAEPIAGLAGLSKSMQLYEEPGAGAREVDRVRNMLTVQPGEAGQKGLERIAGHITEGLDWTAEQTGYDVRDIPEWWREDAVPWMQENTDVKTGAAIGATTLGALVAAMEAGGPRVPTGPTGPIGRQRGALGNQSLRHLRREAGTDAQMRDASVEKGLNRGERTLADRTTLTKNEKGALSVSAQGSGVDPKAAVAAAREWKQRHPVSEWEQPEITGVEVNDKGEFKVKTKQIAYDFHKHPKTGKPVQKGSKQYNKIVNGVVDEITDIARRAEAGDPAAQRIMDEAGWYKNVDRRLHTEYGSFSEMMGDILGATSPNTPVGTNFKFSKDILQRATRGDFDEVMEGFADNLDRRYMLEDAAAEYLEAQRAAGRTKKAAAQDPEYLDMVEEAKAISQRLQANENTIKQAFRDPKTGELKNYGINSYNSMIALADKWRDLRVGSAPKARNFSGNLTGESLKATIDVWAARNLRRHAGYKPIPSSAEKGVTGKVTDADTFTSSMEFGFGQDVLADATAEINARLGMDLDPPDLQALQWFAEKDLWTRKGWTSTTGEGGSFETYMDMDPVGSTFLGISREQSMDYQGRDFVPTPDESRGAAQNIIQAGADDLDVRAVKGNATRGAYMDTPETAMDVDVVTSRETIPTSILDRAVHHAVADDQDSFFVAHRIDDTLGRARPEAFNVGTEIRFRGGLDIESPRIQEIQKELNNQGVPAYTLVTDPRNQNKVIGMRYLDIPQFYDPDRFATISPEGYRQHIHETHQQFAQLGQDLKSKFSEIKSAEPSYFDINVKPRAASKEYLEQLTSGKRDPDVLHSEFYGFKPALTRFKEFSGEVRPYYSRDGNETPPTPGGSSGRVDNPEPSTYRTPDGYTFERQSDGTYSDGDMSFESYDALRRETGHDLDPGDVDADRFLNSMNEPASIKDRAFIRDFSNGLGFRKEYDKTPDVEIDAWERWAGDFRKELNGMSPEQLRHDYELSHSEIDDHIMGMGDYLVRNPEDGILTLVKQGYLPADYEVPKSRFGEMFRNLIQKKKDADVEHRRSQMRSVESERMDSLEFQDRLENRYSEWFRDYGDSKETRAMQRWASDYRDHLSGLTDKQLKDGYEITKDQIEDTVFRSFEHFAERPHEFIPRLRHGGYLPEDHPDHMLKQVIDAGKERDELRRQQQRSEEVQKRRDSFRVVNPDDQASITMPSYDESITSVTKKYGIAGAAATVFPELFGGDDDDLFGGLV